MCGPVVKRHLLRFRASLAKTVDGICLKCLDFNTTLFDKEVRKIYRVIHKSLRDFRTRLRNNQDRHGRKEHINR